MSLVRFRPAVAADRLREDFDREAWPHFREICRSARGLARSRGEAEDLAQEVFLQAWKSFARFERGTNCRAWLYRILWNVHHQKLRKKVPVPLGAEGEARLAETLAAEPPTPTEIKDGEVAAALDAVSPEHRQILLLSDVEEFTYKEIAGILRVPIGTVMSRLSRARAALREKVRGTSAAAGILAGGRAAQGETP